MKTSSVKQLVALTAIVIINIKFVMYFYKRSQLTKPTMSSTDTSKPETRVFASHMGSNSNQTQQFLLAAETNGTDFVSGHYGNRTGYVTPYEYRNILQNVPPESRMMQTFLGLVLDEANHTNSSINAFRKLLHMANSTDVQSRYAQYRMVHLNPAVKTSIPKNQPPAKVRREPEVARTVERLTFEPVGTSHGASFFNMYHAREPQYLSELTPTIPHIIHQTWDSYHIPGVFKPWIQSMVDKHPQWQYWFWTPKDVECLLRTRFSQHDLDTYRKYNAMIFKTDFLRYFLLYEFGGFYVDLDVEALQPLDFWTYKQQCVMSHENYEHTYLLHGRREPNVMTTVIGSRPKHPYFKLLQENLAAYQRKFSRDVLRATGPFYLNDIFIKYMNSNVSNKADNSITVLNPRYWLPKYDYRVTNKLRQSCRASTRLPEHGREVCRSLTRSNFQNRLSSDSFLDHHWTHVNMWKGTQKQKDLFNLFDVVPNAVRVSDKLQCLTPDPNPRPEPALHTRH